MIDILKLRKKVIAEYRKYVESFLDIRDKRLKDFAEKLLNKGDLWPEPLLQCNPGFEKGETIDQLVKDGVLHTEMKQIFKGFHLHKHQAEAIKLGGANKGFIVTSGTGSGKSLTYLGTIFNHVLQQTGQGVKAIIVYPMNALINSQEEEIKKFQRNYLRQQVNSNTDWSAEGKTLDEQIKELSALVKKPFPITFGNYTGQTSDEEKQDMMDNPRHILLTNYKMLELLLTRSREADFRHSIFTSLQFLVFDELHTYRGRQGADVALLVRRIKALAHQPLICMGTSATLSSGDLSQQKDDVAHLGKQLFDVQYNHEQIIMESLQARITRPFPSPNELKDSLSERLPIEEPLVVLEEHPLCCWLEQKVALTNNEGVLVRGKPQTISKIAEKLSEESGVEVATCEQRIDKLLQWLQHVNQHLDDGILPFRVHQFIAQTGTIRVTLESAKEREITAEEQYEIRKNGIQMELFRIVFNRHSGLPYIRVRLSNGELKAWENKTERSLDKDDKKELGYVFLDINEEEPLWDAEREKELVPETWIEKRKSGDRIRKNRADALPKRIWFRANGTYSFAELEGATKGWFMLYPLLLDPLSGVIYNAQTQEFNKLAQLGDAGRSTSTTILSFSTLRQLRALQASERVRKIMSFTDNRQDAALQSGHFNDFIQQLLLRSAIGQAVEQHGSCDASNIAMVVFDALALAETEYAEKAGSRPHQVRENEAIFKKWLLYQLFFDLRRGWRHRLPNLEQCGLLEIRYKNLEEDCTIDKYWKKSDLLMEMDVNKRFEFLRQFLNYFRSSFAVKHHDLEHRAMEESFNKMRYMLKEGWMNENEKPPREPYWMRVEPLKSKTLHTLSIGPGSSLGQYIRLFAKKNNFRREDGEHLDYKDVASEIPNILDCLTEGGFLYCDKELTSVKLYRLELSAIEWVKGDPENMVQDEVRNRSTKKFLVKPNAYFRELYQESPEQLKQLKAREHTGQVPGEKRQEIERDFRQAKVKALFCSPTMELGIDIDELAVVHMRNVPPNPANYAQRSGRAGRKGQGALILTFCSAHSAHDQHFFRKKMDMIKGKVNPQLLDLTNPDLLRTHLNAAYLAKCEIPALNHSLAEVLHLDETDLPLLPDIKEQLSLSIEQKAVLQKEFLEVIIGLKGELEKQSWFSDNWIIQTKEEVPNTFNEVCQRWRDLYIEAFNAKKNSTAQLRGAQLTKSSPEYKAATSMLHQSQRKLDLLRNKAGFKDFSEFYPYRYLASEGFLPGYNFTRLPLRIYLGDGKGTGTYISLPRMRAITEFGPQNILYQGGKKWRVSQMNLPPNEGELPMHRLLIDKSTGSFSLKNSAQADLNHLSGAAKCDVEIHHLASNLVEMQHMTAWSNDRISCQEDERNSTRFDTELGFEVRPDADREVKITLSKQQNPLLQIQYFPGASLVTVNHKPIRNKDHEYFLIDSRTGVWKSNKERTDDKIPEEERALIREVQLFTSVVTDCLYIQPQRTLNLEKNGVVTLMFALKEAIQQHYKIEEQELKCELQGDPKHPNILFYEAAEGNLGILSRLVADKTQWEPLIEKMSQICRLHEDQNDSPAATYDDLLSYFNQSFHQQINRFLIRTALQSLQGATVDLHKASSIKF